MMRGWNSAHSETAPLETSAIGAQSQHWVYFDALTDRSQRFSDDLPAERTIYEEDPGFGQLERAGNRSPTGWVPGYR
jgi:hypothetical protein